MRWASAIILACVCLPAIPAEAQLFPGLPCDGRQFRLEQLSEHHLRLTGEVELECDTFDFFADEIDIFTDEHRLVAVGNVVYATDDGAHLAAERAELNTETLTGTFHHASGSIHIGDDIERSMFGSQEPEMYFYGEMIERLSARRYRLTNGGFTSCIQPTPRWELTSSSFTINVDEHAVMRNTVLNVKGVPVFYLPVMYYPIQDDGRATGFLMPMYGTSTFRGQSLSNAFFWAIGRSHDATLFHDWFTQTGQGIGAEYRYVLGDASEGQARTYLLNEHATTINDIEQPARRSYEIRASARQQLTRNLTARGNVDFFSDITVRQTYHNNIYESSNRERTMSGNIAGSWGAYQLSGTFETNETFFGDRQATRWGGAPRINVGQGQRPIPGTPAYFSFSTEYVRLLRRSTRNPGANESVVDSGLDRWDVYPIIQVPFTRWPFLTINSSVAWRGTYWTEQIDPVTNQQVASGISRSIVELQSQLIGPTFVKVWDTPGGGYAQRMKHVIEPWVSAQRVSAFDAFSQIVRLEGVDSIVGGVTQVRYGLNNRLYAKQAQGDQAAVAREILSVSISQSYYTDAQAAQYDRLYRTSFNETQESHFSPISLVVRGDPTDSLTATMRAEYDTQFSAFRTISADGTLRLKDWLEQSIGWSQRRFIEGLNGFNNEDQLDHALSWRTRVRTASNTIGGTYQFNYDLLRDRYLQQRVLVYYNAQCCGVSAEFQSFNFQGLNTRAPVAQDRRFNLSFTLAGLGTFANVFGAFGGGVAQ